jgi:hypothetical protein
MQSNAITDVVWIGVLRPALKVLLLRVRCGWSTYREQAKSGQKKVAHGASSPFLFVCESEQLDECLKSRTRPILAATPEVRPRRIPLTGTLPKNRS